MQYTTHIININLFKLLCNHILSRHAYKESIILIKNSTIKLLKLIPPIKAESFHFITMGKIHKKPTWKWFNPSLRFGEIKCHKTSLGLMFRRLHTKWAQEDFKRTFVSYYFLQKCHAKENQNQRSPLHDFYPNNLRIKYCKIAAKSDSALSASDRDLESLSSILRDAELPMQTGVK